MKQRYAVTYEFVNYCEAESKEEAIELSNKQMNYSIQHGYIGLTDCDVKSAKPVLTKTENSVNL